MINDNDIKIPATSKIPDKDVDGRDGHVPVDRLPRLRQTVHLSGVQRTPRIRRQRPRQEAAPDSVRAAAASVPSDERRTAGR